MKHSRNLQESFKNYIDPKEKESVVDVAWDLLQKAYEPIGGYGSHDSKEHLITDSFLWKVDQFEGKATAVIIYKKNARGWRKLVGVATDQSTRGKAKLIEMIGDDLTKRDMFMELSGPLEKFVEKKFPNNKVQNKYVESLLNSEGGVKKKNVTPEEDGYHYTRSLNGHDHTKIMYASDSILNELNSISEMVKRAVSKLF